MLLIHNMLKRQEKHVILTNVQLFDRIRGTVVYIRPLKLQASLQAHDLARKYELVAAGHRFEKVSVLVKIAGKFYLKKLEWT